MPILVHQEQLNEIERQGELAFPHECCGFLLGTTSAETREVSKVVPATNAREDKARHNRFLITPESYMETDRAARECSLEIIGFYHSHPNSPAQPSEFDKAHAWPQYSYIITSVIEGKAGNTRSWTLKEDRSAFGPEEILHST